MPTVANTLAYYDTATFTALKSFIQQARGWEDDGGQRPSLSISVQFQLSPPAPIIGSSFGQKSQKTKW